MFPRRRQRRAVVGHHSIRRRLARTGTWVRHSTIPPRLIIPASPRCTPMAIPLALSRRTTNPHTSPSLSPQPTSCSRSQGDPKHPSPELLARCDRVSTSVHLPPRPRRVVLASRIAPNSLLCFLYTLPSFVPSIILPRPVSLNPFLDYIIAYFNTLLSAIRFLLSVLVKSASHRNIYTTLPNALNTVLLAVLFTAIACIPSIFLHSIPLSIFQL